MAFVYILWSEGLRKFYTGSCIDLEERLLDHFEGRISGSYTSKASDWELFVSIDGLGYEQSRKMESHIKQMRSASYVRNLKKYPEMVEALKKRFS